MTHNISYPFVVSPQCGHGVVFCHELLCPHLAQQRPAVRFPSMEYSACDEDFSNPERARHNIVCEVHAVILERHFFINIIIII